MNRTLFNRIRQSYRWLIQPVLVLVILTAGYLSAKGLTLFNAEPPKAESVNYAPLVKTVLSRVESRILVIRGNGSIQARTRINVVPQVGGKVTRIHPQLRPGGYFKANQVLVEIEPIDYQLAVTSAESDVATAQRTLQLESAEAEAAIEEWNELHAGQSVPILVSRTPQIAEAKASLQAAKARLQRARLDLQRTRIRMPFSGRVVQASIDVGEVVNANQSVAVVYDTEVFDIPVPLEVDQLAWLDVGVSDSTVYKQPEADDDHSGVDIVVKLAAQEYRLRGQLARIESELDSVSRMVRAVVSLNHEAIPRELREEVIPGLFVNVEVQARKLEDITVLPAALLREGGVLWVVSDNRLEYFRPRILYQSDGEIWIKAMPADMQIISSSLDVVTEGMQVRIQDQS
ncbi:MAG: efflux RND transporter periplasmic adaptor subunit [Gammaproteobacteria bacterium]|nr:efflux RND transporter periplasmic adaptor subunit [Gammaproteobacteria bacterium]